MVLWTSVHRKGNRAAPVVEVKVSTPAGAQHGVISGDLQFTIPSHPLRSLPIKFESQFFQDLLPARHSNHNSEQIFTQLSEAFT